METQYMSLFISGITVLVLVMLLLLRKRGFIFYFSMIMSFSAETAYYTYLLYFGGLGHDASSLLRVFQTTIFGVYFLLELLDEIYTKLKIKKIERKTKNLQKISSNLTKGLRGKMQ